MSAGQQASGTYHEYKGDIRSRFGSISDDDFEKAAGSFEKLVGVIQKQTGEARQTIEKFLNNLTNSASQTAGEAAAYAQHYADRAGQGIREGYESAASAVKSKPMESVVIALGAGIAVGALLGLMMTSNRK